MNYWTVIAYLLETVLLFLFCVTNDSDTIFFFFVYTFVYVRMCAQQDVNVHFFVCREPRPHIVVRQI